MPAEPRTKENVKENATNTEITLVPFEMEGTTVSPAGRLGLVVIFVFLIVALLAVYAILRRRRWESLQPKKENSEARTKKAAS
jgi:hypothetical protein